MLAEDINQAPYLTAGNATLLQKSVNRETATSPQGQARSPASHWKDCTHPGLLQLCSTTQAAERASTPNSTATSAPAASHLKLTLLVSVSKYYPILFFNYCCLGFFTYNAQRFFTRHFIYRTSHLPLDHSITHGRPLCHLHALHAGGLMPFTDGKTSSTKSC